MGMRHYGNHGYTVKASELIVTMPGEHQDRFKTLVEEGDWEEAQNMIDEHLTVDIPIPYLFVMSDETHDSDGLEMGEMYAVWDTDELFEMIPLTGLELLKQQNINPELNNWVSYG